MYDVPNKNDTIDVAVAVNHVMVVKDHGTDEEWAAKAAAQQRALIQSAQTLHVPQLEAPQKASHEAAKSVACLRPVDVSQAAPVAPSWQPLN